MRAFFLPAMVAGVALTIAAIPAAGQAPQAQAPQAQAPQAQAPQAPGQDLKPAADRDREMAVKPELPHEQAAQFATRGAACGPSVKSAFHVSGNWHGSAGADAPLIYPTVVTNVGNNFANFFQIIGVFTAPCDSQYFFTVSFVKDSYYNTCGGNVGTTDDVSIYLTKFVGNTTTIIDPGQSAWSGEGAGRRGTGVLSIVLTLNGGDQIGSWVHSDGGFHRCLAAYRFTGFRVAP